MSNLKEYILKNFDIRSLKEIGFIPKEVRPNDYIQISNIICNFFGFKDIYEYTSEKLHLLHSSENRMILKTSDVVTSNGKLKSGVAIHLLVSPINDSFECPHCSKNQKCNDFKSYRLANDIFANIKCTGCKRKLTIFTNPFDGSITIHE